MKTTAVKSLIVATLLAASLAACAGSSTTADDQGHVLFKASAISGAR